MSFFAKLRWGAPAPEVENVPNLTSLKWNLPPETMGQEGGGST